MNVLSVIIILFIVLEGANVFLLYFFPQSKKGNGVGIFDAYEKSKALPDVHLLIKYLVNWIAGSKLIFIALLLVIVLTGDETTQIYSLIALIVSIATFFWRLYPLIKVMDKQNQISPKGYSKTLAIMIAFFMLMFIFALSYYLLIKM